MFTARHVTKADDAGFTIPVFFFPWTIVSTQHSIHRIIGVSKTYATMAHFNTFTLSSFVAMQSQSPVDDLLGGSTVEVRTYLQQVFVRTFETYESAQDKAHQVRN